ncbi:MAG: hypothetical protein ABS99_04140 [Acetobacteraceae bacterium SCN 69-10]|nr:FkbM family methyltransferase [Rhodospirillales bacterium]ODU58746.1 MAG: hypothetical protein ABS99_04140 [Acetobacteraceae bacterium SCN 69-10]OJY68267.1 MAG: hypothetical protein BGP12_11015 [Rhodospirillales bacterium 70-18]
MHATDPLADNQPDARVAPLRAPSIAASITPLQRELLEKMEMEAALLAAPSDQALRGAYFDLLFRFAALRTGLSHALLPELGHPLYFRCGSSDVANLAQIFRDGAQGFAMRATPLHILDLGAYAGYAAIYLARRFPQARLLCVEPSPDSFRLLALNTIPYRRIERLQAAVWHHPTRLGVAARYYGDWGTRLQDDVPEEARTIPAEDVPGLLRLAGWARADLVKCDIEGAEAAVFADPHAGWLHTLDALAIETHDTVQPGCAAIVGACFDPALFERTQHGETTLYERRVPFRALLRPPPRTMRLIHAEPGLFPLALQGVSTEPWGFFTFDGTSCQLHPNPPDGPPARAIFPRTLDGQTRLACTLTHAGHDAGDIRFTLLVEREDATVAARADHVLAAGTSLRVELKLPDPPAEAPPWQGLHGRHRIVLQTAMADGATHNHNAWARWIDPRLI